MRLISTILDFVIGRRLTTSPKAVSVPAATAVLHLLSTPSAAPPVPRKRRLTAVGWQRVLIDTAVHDHVLGERGMARIKVFAAAAGMPVADFWSAAKVRYDQKLARDVNGRRPVEVVAFAAQLDARVSIDPTVPARLAEVKLMVAEANRRAKVAHRRKEAVDKVAAAKGMAALLAAAALVGRSMKAVADDVAVPPTDGPDSAV